MDINEILRKKGMTKYRLSVLSGVPHATLNNICSGQSRIEKCSAETLYKLAQILHVTIEDLIIDSICHRIKDSGDIAFIIETLKSNEIRQYYDKKQYPQAFYLLAMVDYLSREHRLPLYNAYNDMRKQKLADPIYPQSILALAKVMEDDSILSDSLEKAIPEFRRFNIAENEMWNIV